MLNNFIDIDNRIQHDLNDENIYSAKDAQDPKDVRVNIQELERSVYRPTMRGLAFQIRGEIKKKKSLKRKWYIKVAEAIPSLISLGKLEQLFNEGYFIYYNCQKKK